MGVGLGLHLSGEESSIQTELFIAGYSCSSYMPKGRYWHHSRKVCPNGWLSPHEAITPLPSTLSCFKRTQRALWLMIQGTFGILGSLENNLCRFLSIYTGRATTICRPHIQPDLGRIWQKWGGNILLDTHTCTRVQTRAQTRKHTEAKGARDVCGANWTGKHYSLYKLTSPSCTHKSFVSLTWQLWWTKNCFSTCLLYTQAT